MRIGLLGELEVLDDDGNERHVAGAKLRALLAVLALHVGRVVPAEQLVDALWGDDPPAAVRNGLAGTGVEAATGVGFSRPCRHARRRLRPGPAARRRSTSGGSSSAPRTGGRWRRRASWTAPSRCWPRPTRCGAASRWPTSPTTTSPSAAIARLSESRLAAARGTARPRAPAGPSPTCHRPARGARRRPSAARGLRGLLMLALYRAGRQADALRIFQEGRQLLGRGARPGTGARASPAGVGDPRARTPR